MTRFERWYLHRILRREVVQGYDHDQRISALYAMIHDACRQEFSEENDPTLDDALREWFERTQWNSMYRLSPQREYRLSIYHDHFE